MAGVYIGLGLVAAAWVGRASSPSKLTNAAGWLFALLITIVLVCRALGLVVIE